MEEAEIGALGKLGDTDKYGSLRSPGSGSSGGPRVTVRSSELGQEKVGSRATSALRIVF